MTTTEPATALPTSSKVLCAVYAVIAVVALIATWSQNAAYFDDPGGFLLDFLNDSKVTPASRSLSADIVLFFLAAGILMVIEARKARREVRVGLYRRRLCHCDQRDLPPVPDRQGTSRREIRNHSVGCCRRRAARAVGGRRGGHDHLGRHGLIETETR
jgi:hypothetical protein